MRPAYAKIVQRLTAPEAQLKPPALQLMAFVQKATDITALKVMLLANILTATCWKTALPIE